MLVYNATKHDFINSVVNDTIVDDIYSKYQEFIGRSNKSQINSWKNSMEYMYKVLNLEDIPSNAGVAIEFTIPSTSKRIDFIISGYDKNKKDSVIIIELKQWEEAEKVEGKDGIVKTYVGKGLREVTHPSYQAWSYASLLEDFNQTVQENSISLYPCAYLHNYNITSNDPISDEIYLEYLNKAPLYGKGDVLKLREFILKYIKYGDNKNILCEIENGKIRPSQRLQDVLLSMLKGNSHFVMIDEQKIAYELAVDMAHESFLDEKKRVLIIEGGPGTGKSVVAINLLVNLINDELLTFYVTKNSAPRNVYFEQLKGTYTQKEIKNLFRSSGIFHESDKNEFDTLIIDEAHRLNERSGFFKNMGENQVKEIINASKCSIFFIDNNQKVTISDIGSVEVIEDYAIRAGAELHHIQLESQFRCNGSDGYLLWLDDVLQIQETANYDGFDYEYDFQVIDNPEKLKEMIFEKNKINNNSRMLAGYCWDWLKEERNNTKSPDVIIDDFSMSWNLDNTETWAIDEDSIHEIGCVHTSQGLEFDYVGVILGEDISYKDGKILTDFNKRAKTDQSLKGIKKLYKKDSKKALEIADEVIKNTYRTLMTRGMKGCYIYCVDEELQKYFKNCIMK
ncbi:DNA/RNA helicase domain-containing protein [Methanobrevibacter sp. DSM 116169]|uniref:DNA/RNA helicase domain-containing protein n=1 Tax=Methanobrevibacter sp. DSM 116169 TaxID=3242727 RepID=UPI0038FD160F